MDTSTDSCHQLVDEDVSRSHWEKDSKKLNNSPLQTHRKLTQCKGCTFYMEPLLFIFQLSFHPFFLIMPQYILGRELKKLTGNDNITVNTNSCVGDPGHNSTASDSYDPIKGNFTQAQSAASIFMLQSTLVTSLPAIVIVIFAGAYSDQRGRRFIMIPSLVGGALSSLNTLLNAYFQWPIELILVGNFLNGCTGSWMSLYMGAYSYTADVTTKESRQFRMVLIEVVSNVPSIISTGGSGFVLDTVGFTWMFFFIFLLNFIILLYAVFVVPESVEPDPEARFFSLEFLKNAIKVLVADDETKRRQKILLLLAALFFSMLVATGGNVTTLFMMNYPLCWGSELVGIQTSVVTAIAVVGSATTDKIFSCFLRDAWIAVIAGVMNVTQNIFMFFVTTTALMFASAIFRLMYILLTPTIRAMLSKTVKPHEVGAVFGGVAFLEGLCELLRDVIMNPIYSSTQAMGMPSLVFLVMAGIYLVALILMIYYALLTRNGQKEMAK